VRYLRILGRTAKLDNVMKKIHLIEALWADAHISFIFGADTTDWILLAWQQGASLYAGPFRERTFKAGYRWIHSLSGRHAENFADRSLGVKWQ
jgi:hypothetical protein